MGLTALASVVYVQMAISVTSVISLVYVKTACVWMESMATEAVQSATQTTGVQIAIASVFVTMEYVTTVLRVTADAFHAQRAPTGPFAANPVHV